MKRKYPFFFMYTEARNDAKLRSLTDAEFRVWFNLLCYAAEQPERGSIRGITARLLAVEVAGGDVDLLCNACIALQALHVVTWSGDAAGTAELTFINFDSRQSTKPSDAPERVRERVAKSRERKTSDDVTPCNAPVSRYGDTVTRCNAPEKELEREEYNPPLPPPTGGVDDGGGKPAPLPIIPAAAPVQGPIRPDPSPIPNTPDPATLANLVAIARSSLGDRGEIEDYPMKVDGWLRSYPADWVRDAILCTAAKTDLRPGGLAAYTAACLRKWYPKGPDRGEVESARRRAGNTPAPVLNVVRDDGLFAAFDRDAIRKRKAAGS